MHFVGKYLLAFYNSKTGSKVVNQRVVFIYQFSVILVLDGWQYGWPVHAHNN